MSYEKSGLLPHGIAIGPLDLLTGGLVPTDDILIRLYHVLEARKVADPDTSYVSRLYAEGLDAILKKIGEEATETVMAAKDGDHEHLVREIADLWFHCLVLLVSQNLRPQDVLDELQQRFGTSGLTAKARRA